MTIKVPQSQSGETPAPSELRTSRITLPEGFSINPNAADGKVACPDIDDRDRHAVRGRVPGVLEDRDARPRRRGAARPDPGRDLPRRTETRRTVPGRSSPPTASRPTSSCSARSGPTRRPGRLTLVFEDLPQSPLQEFDLHVFGSERGLFATPPKCGTCRSAANSCPGTTSCSTRTRPSFMDFTGGPNGTPLPGRHAALRPGRQAGCRQQHGRRPQPVQPHPRPRRTATRT